jgi:hypothetical protein
MTTAIGSTSDRATVGTWREPSAADWLRLVVHPDGDFALMLREREGAGDEVCCVSIPKSGAMAISFRRM